MKYYVKASSDKAWNFDEDYFMEMDDYDFEDFWSAYLSLPEDEVNTELQIFPEPSVQGGMGSMYIFDESGEERFSDVSVDFGEWCDKQMVMAMNSKSAEDYKRQYREWVKDLCNI